MTPYLHVTAEHLEAMLEAAFVAGATRGLGPMPSDEIAEYAATKMKHLTEVELPSRKPENKWHVALLSGYVWIEAQIDYWQHKIENGPG